jgi:hypothetical protein
MRPVQLLRQLVDVSGTLLRRIVSISMSDRLDSLHARRLSVSTLRRVWRTVGGGGVRPFIRSAGSRRPVLIHAAAAAAGRERGSVSNGILMGFYRRLCSAARPCPALTDRSYCARDPDAAAASRPTSVCRSRRDPQPGALLPIRQRRPRQWKRPYRVSPGDAMSARR